MWTACSTSTTSITGVWPRLVALLLRHALEEALRRYWQARKPQLARRTPRPCVWSPMPTRHGPALVRDLGRPQPGLSLSRV